MTFSEACDRKLKDMIKLNVLKKNKVVFRKKQPQEEDQPIKGNYNNIEKQNDEHPKNQLCLTILLAQHVLSFFSN